MREKKLSGNKWLLYLGGTAALISGGLFLVAAIILILTILISFTTTSWLSVLNDNWLMVIFKLLSGFSDMPATSLEGVNALDVTLLLLVGITMLGLFVVLRKRSRIWTVIASALPFLGLVIFIITQMAGRSAVMLAMLVISMIMLRSPIFRPIIAWLGIIAAILLLAGDFSVGSSFTYIIAPLFGVGYLLSIAWYFLVGFKLFHINAELKSS